MVRHPSQYEYIEETNSEVWAELLAWHFTTTFSQHPGIVMWALPFRIQFLARFVTHQRRMQRHNS